MYLCKDHKACTLTSHSTDTGYSASPVEYPAPQHEEIANKAAVYHVTCIPKLAQQQNHTSVVYLKQENRENPTGQQSGLRLLEAGRHELNLKDHLLELTVPESSARSVQSTRLPSGKKNQNGSCGLKSWHFLSFASHTNSAGQTSPIHTSWCL